MSIDTKSPRQGKIKKKKLKSLFTTEFDLPSDVVLKEINCKVKSMGKNIEGVLFITQNHVCFANNHSLILHYKTTINYKDVTQLTSTGKGICVTKTNGKKLESTEFFGFEDANAVLDFIDKTWREQTGAKTRVKLPDEPTKIPLLSVPPDSSVQEDPTGRSEESDIQPDSNSDEEYDTNDGEEDESAHEGSAESEEKEEKAVNKVQDETQLANTVEIKSEQTQPTQTPSSQFTQISTQSQRDLQEETRMKSSKDGKSKKRKSLRNISFPIEASPSKALALKSSAPKSDNIMKKPIVGNGASVDIAPFISLKPSSTAAISKYFPVRDPPASKGKMWTEIKWEKPSWEKDFSSDSEPDESPLKQWNCAQKVKGNISHGLMFVTHRAVYFTNYNMGGQTTRTKIIIDLQDVSSITSNGKTIEIHRRQINTKPVEFCEFKDLDDAHKLLVGLWTPFAIKVPVGPASSNGTNTSANPGSSTCANSNANNPEHKTGRLTQLVRSLSEKSIPKQIGRRVASESEVVKASTTSTTTSTTTTTTSTPTTTTTATTSTTTTVTTSKIEKKRPLKTKSQTVKPQKRNLPVDTKISSTESPRQDMDKCASRNSAPSAKHNSTETSKTPLENLATKTVSQIRDRSRSTGNSPKKSRNDDKIDNSTHSFTIDDNYARSDEDIDEFEQDVEQTEDQADQQPELPPEQSESQQQQKPEDIKTEQLAVLSADTSIPTKEIFTVENPRNELDSLFVERIDAINVYSAEFTGDKHLNFMVQKNRVCCAIISISRFSEPFPPELGEPGEGYKGVVLDKNGLESFYVTRTAVKRGNTSSAFEYFFTKISVDPSLTFVRVEAPEFSKKVQELIVQHVKPVTGLKIGVLYVVPGQKTIETIFANQPPPDSHFWEFMAGLGERINLRGWTGYLGDFGQAEEDRYTYFTNWENVDFMFHVTPLLTSEQHRRLIGNDICFIIYVDTSASSENFDPSTVQELGVMPQVFTVIHPTQQNNKMAYRLSFFNRASVKSYPPTAPPKDHMFDIVSLKNYLFTKLHNGYVMCTKCPPMNRLFSVPREAAIKDLGGKFVVTKRKSSRRPPKGKMKNSPEKEKTTVPSPRSKQASPATLSTSTSTLPNQGNSSVTSSLSNSAVNSILKKSVTEGQINLPISKPTPISAHSSTLSSSSIPASAGNDDSRIRSGSTPPSPKSVTFNVYIQHENTKKSILYQPAELLRNVLTKICQARGITLDCFVAKNFEGKIMALDTPLSEIVGREVSLMPRVLDKSSSVDEVQWWFRTFKEGKFASLATFFAKDDGAGLLGYSTDQLAKIIGDERAAARLAGALQDLKPNPT